MQVIENIISYCRNIGITLIQIDVIGIYLESTIITMNS